MLTENNTGMKKRNDEKKRHNKKCHNEKPCPSVLCAPIKVLKLNQEKVCCPKL